MESFHSWSKTWTFFLENGGRYYTFQSESGLDSKEDFRESNPVIGAQIRSRSPVRRQGPHIDRQG